MEEENEIKHEGLQVTTVNKSVSKNYKMKHIKRSMNAANSQVILYNKMEKKYNVERCNTQPKCNNNHGCWDEL